MIHKGDASNTAVRALLTLLGEKHDLAVLGTPPGELRDKKLKARLAEEFNNQCAYCGTTLIEKMEVDHVVPMNQKSLGLHMYGNLVPACTKCNQVKHSKTLDEFLAVHVIPNPTRIKRKIQDRAVSYGAYDRNEELRILVSGLYVEVSDLVSKKADVVFGSFQESSPATKAHARKIQKKSEFDFSGIAAAFPLGSWVVAIKDGLVGEVVDYSLEGPIGRRTPYVKFLSYPDGRKIRRSPAQLKKIKDPRRLS